MATRRAVKSKTTSKKLHAGKRVPPARKTKPAKRVTAAKSATKAIIPVAKKSIIVQAKPEERTLRDNPRLDRRIIEGMLHDRDGLMDEMADKGVKPDQVVRRAAELGLSEALLRQVKGVAADLAGERPGRKSPPPSLGARTCLCCDRIFLSAGPGNRLCMRCRGGDAGLAAL